MKFHKKLKAIVSFICVVSLLCSICSFSAYAVTVNTVTASTNSKVTQGNSATCYIYIDSTESLASLDVSVHFDNTKIKIGSVYNSLSCKLYDNAVNSTNIQFSYILDGKGSDSKTTLFTFTYTALSNAEVGDSYFDIVVGEAYDSSLNEVAVSGSRCNFTITEKSSLKSCTVYGNGYLSTKIGEEFTLSYRFSGYQLASGCGVITYDPEVFQLVEVEKGDFFNGKISDINSDFKGSIYISFVDTKYNYKYDLMTVKFKTIKNVSTTSDIKLNVTELYDLNRNAVSCSGYNTRVTIAFDESYVENAPAMSVHAEFDSTTEQVTAQVTLEENSKLGAGDFVINFDPAQLIYKSSQKEFEPDFFIVNDKKVADGVLKFSIISFDDIMTEEKVLSLNFDTVLTCNPEPVVLRLSGSMITDSLTNTIPLKFADGNVDIPKAAHSYSNSTDIECDSCGYKRVVTKVSVTKEPDIKTYLEAEDELDVTGGKLTIYYNDGASGVIDITPSMVTGFDNTKAGKQTLTVSYGGFSDTFDVKIVARSITSVEVIKAPTKVIYLEAKENLDLSGGKLTIHYDNNTSEDIDLSETEVTGFDNTKPGFQGLTVSYNGFKTILNIYIQPKSLSSIKVTTLPDKLQYIEAYESLDLTGGKLTLYYNNDTSKVISLTPDMVSGFDNTILGVQTLTVTYSGKLAVFEVEVVKKALESIEVTTLPDNLVFVEKPFMWGNSIYFSGGYITLYYNNGTTEELPLSAANVYGYNPEKIGKQALTVSYGGKKTSFEIEVIPKSITHIYVSMLPSKLTYLEGKETLDLSGGKVCLCYDNGHSDHYELSKAEVTGFDNTKVGRQTLTVNYNGFSCNFAVEIVAKSLESIEVTTLPQKLEYLEVKDNLDVTGGKVTLYYNNDTTEVIDLTSSMVKGFDNTKVGKQTLTINYRGFSDSFSVEVVAKTLTDISVYNPPYKTTYVELKDNLDLSGGILRLTYDNGTSEFIDLSEAQISGFDNSEVGRITLSVKYNEKETSFDVIIVPKNITGIELTELPSKLEYLEGKDNIDLSGGKLMLYFDNNTSKEIELSDADILGFDNTKIGKQTLTVSYGDFSDSFEIEIVAKKLKSIKVTTLPSKLVYLESEDELDLSGGKLTLYYNNDTEKVIDLTSDMVSNFDNTVVGYHVLTVNYENVSCIFMVEVISKSLIEIKLSVMPEKTEYLEGKSYLDLTGGKLKLIFNNDTTEEIDLSKATVTGFDNTKVGTQTLIVNYDGFRTTFDVEVIAKSLAKISVSQLPQKTEYLEAKDVLNLSGGKLLLTYNNGTTEEVKLSEATVTGFDNTKVGIQTVTVNYGEFSTAFYVEIIAKNLIQISISEPPEKTEYLEAKDVLDLTGGKLKLIFNNDTTEEIDLSKATVTGFDNTKVGMQTITVTMGYFSTTFDVKVIAKTLTEISVSQLPQKTVFTQGKDNLDLTGGMLLLVYNNGFTEEITLSEATVTGFDNSKVGKQILTVTYDGLETTYIVEIQSAQTEPTLPSEPSTDVTDKPEEPSTDVTDKPEEPSEPSTDVTDKPEEPSDPVEDKGILGDVNDDGKVNIKDATMIQKAAAKLISLTDSENIRANVNGDAKVNVKDATAIQKYVAKIETGYPIGEKII